MTRLRHRAGAVLVGAALLAAAPAAAQEAVDLELVFAVDASGSIDPGERRLQREGYAAAITDAGVLGAIRGGYLQRIAVTFLEWAAPGCERIVVPWTVIADAESAQRFAAAVVAGPVHSCPGGNAIGDAIDFAAAMIGTNALEGTRRVIDVSGDGPNNRGGPVEAARDRAVAAGITVNGLAIVNPGRSFGGLPGEPLETHYRNRIIGGPGAFVLTTRDDPADFTVAVRSKLILEIASRP